MRFDYLAMSMFSVGILRVADCLLGPHGYLPFPVYLCIVGLSFAAYGFHLWQN